MARVTQVDHMLCRELATAAGDRLLAIRVAQRDLSQEELKAAGDTAGQEFLARELNRLRPGDAVLSEEAEDTAARFAAQRVWIIDPLDGTREFSEPGRDDWAIHVALWENGELVAGAVALPARGSTLATDDVPTIPPGKVGKIRIAVSRSRPPELVPMLVQQLDAEMVPMGSAGVKAMSVLLGETDAYVHGGGQYEWDSAAPVAVARAAGLHTSRLDGSPLRYNQPDPLLPDLLICRPELAAPLLAALTELV